MANMKKLYLCSCRSRMTLLSNFGTWKESYCILKQGRNLLSCSKILHIEFPRESMNYGF